MSASSAAHRIATLPRSAVAVAGFGLVALCIACGAFLAWTAIRGTIAGNLGTLQGTSRMVQDQAVRTIEATGVTLTSLADAVTATVVNNGDVIQVGNFFSNALKAQPDLRSIAVLDMNGVVLTSSNPLEQGVTVPLGIFGPLPAPGLITVTPPLPGRYLMDLVGRSTAPAGVDFIPVVYHSRPSDGPELIAIGLLNTAAFVAYQNSAIEASAKAASSVLAFSNGKVIASSEGGVDPRLLAPNGPLFERFRDRAQDMLELSLSDRPPVLVAYRHARGLPIVAIAQQPRSAAVSEALEPLQWLLPVVGVAAATVFVITLLAMRSMRLREQQVAELNAAQSKIEAGERRLRTVVESVQELIFRTDAKGIVRFTNQRWAGMAISVEPVGLHLSRLVLLPDRDRANGLLEDGERGGLRTALIGMRGDDGKTLLFEMAVTPLIEDGVLLGFAGSAVNITQRVAAERRAEARSRFLDLLQDIAPLPICMTDTEGRFISVNRAWEDFMKRSRAEVIGLRNVDFLPPQEATAFDAHGERLLKEGGRVHYEEKLILADGTERNVQVSKVMVPNDDGTPMGLLAVKLDITEFRRAQAIAETASRSKSEFVANISHELRTPLQSILGFSELGLRRSGAQGQIALMFEDIHSSGQKMLELVNDLLDISKIESSVGNFRFAPTDVRKCVNVVTQELEPLLERRKQHLTNQVPEQPVVAQVDEVRIQQVIRNILANAIKFSPEGGRIDIETRVSALNPEQPEVTIVVTDQGPGVPEAEKELIFQPFIQSSATSRHGAGGTGLGLAICQKIVESHGGSIKAGNRLEGGAVFELRLPMGVKELS